MAEVPLFPTTSLSCTYLLTLLRILVVWREHHSHNFLSRNPDSRSHRRASTSLTTMTDLPDSMSHRRASTSLTTMTDLPDSGVQDGTSRIGVYSSVLQVVESFRVYVDPLRLWIFLYSTPPKFRYHQNFPNVLTRISLSEFQRTLSN